VKRIGIKGHAFVSIWVPHLVNPTLVRLSQLEIVADSAAALPCAYRLRTRIYLSDQRTSQQSGSGTVSLHRHCLPCDCGSSATDRRSTRS